MANIIVFEPRYKIGDIVVLKLNPEHKMIIDAYKLVKISDSGEVLFFYYGLYDGTGVSYSFIDQDLIAITEVV